MVLCGTQAVREKGGRNGGREGGRNGGREGGQARGKMRRELTSFPPSFPPSLPLDQHCHTGAHAPLLHLCDHLPSFPSPSLPPYFPPSLPLDQHCHAGAPAALLHLCDHFPPQRTPRRGHGRVEPRRHQNHVSALPSLPPSLPALCARWIFTEVSK